MDNNTYLNFIYEIANKDYLQERIKITKFLKDKKVDDKDIVKRSINVNFFVCEIEMEDKRLLLLEDIPVNFLLSYTIIIGDRTQIVEFLSNGKKYVCDKGLFDKVKEHYEIDSSSLREVKPRELFNKKYFLHFSQPVIISHLKEYVSSIKKLPFNRTHIVKGDKIENFIPTIKKKHLAIAEQMNIPLVNLLKNNYIKGSTINIYDDERIKSIINPVFTSSKKILWDVHRKNKLKLYKDVSREYYIEYDRQKVIDELLCAHIVNFDKDSVAKQIKDMRNIVLSSNHGRYALPVWKSSNEQRFILVENIEAFNAMAGVEFKLDTEFFDDIYLQTLSGEQAIYKPRFLSDDLNRAFEELSKSQKIEFKTIKELVIKILYNLEMGVMEIIKKEDLNKNKIKQFDSKISKIIEKVIMTSIEFNRKPKYKRPSEIFEQYYFSVANSVLKLLEKYKEYPCEIDLLNNALKICERISNSFKMHELNAQELYFVSLLIMNLLKVQEVFNEKRSKDLKEHFFEYFADFEVMSKYEGTSPDIESLVDDIFFTNKVSLKRKVFVIGKQNMYMNAFVKNVEIVDGNLQHFSIVKPNVEKLREVFKYSYKDAISQIASLSVNDVRGGAKIAIRGREVDLREDYYSIFNVYSDYNVILDNEYFSVLVSKASPQNNFHF